MRKLFLISILLSAFISNAQQDSSKSVESSDGPDPSDSPNLPRPPQVFNAVQEMPEFIGGEGAMMKFLAENLIYPDSAKIKGVQGKLRVKFTITPTGEIIDAHIITKIKLGYGCEEEAIRVIMKMPKWKPGKQNGNAVYVYFNIPITFKLY